MGVSAANAAGSAADYSPPAGEYSVTVRSGDTLSGIASREATKLARTQPGTAWKSDLTYQAIAKYNDIDDPNHIDVGQQIKIPDSKTLTQISQELASEKPGRKSGSARPAPSCEAQEVFAEQLYADAPVEIVEVNPNLLAPDTAHVIGEVCATIDEQFPEVSNQISHDDLADAIAENLTDDDGDGKAELNLDMLKASLEARGVSVEPAFADNLSDALRIRGGLHEYIDDAKLNTDTAKQTFAQKKLSASGFYEQVNNPLDLHQVKAFFDTLRASGASTKTYLGTMQAYVQTYFSHVGDDVNDNFNISADTDFSRFAVNHDGQTMIDCTMYSDIYKTLLGDHSEKFDYISIGYDDGGHSVTGSFQDLGDNQYEVVVTDNDQIFSQLVIGPMTDDLFETKVASLLLTSGSTTGSDLVTGIGMSSTKRKDATQQRVATSDPNSPQPVHETSSTSMLGQVALDQASYNLNDFSKAITIPINTRSDEFKRAQMIVSAYENGALTRKNPREEAAFELAYAMVKIDAAQKAPNTDAKASYYKDEVLPHLQTAKGYMQTLAEQTQQKINHSGSIAFNPDGITADEINGSISKAQSELSKLQTPPPEPSYGEQLYNWVFGS